MKLDDELSTKQRVVSGTPNHSPLYIRAMLGVVARNVDKSSLQLRRGDYQTQPPSIIRQDVGGGESGRDSVTAFPASE